MAARKTLNISLTPQLSKYVAQRVNSGQYTSASEVVRESLRLMQKQEAAKQWLRRAIQKGLDDSNAGRLVDGEKFIAQLLTRSAKARPRRKAG